MSALHGWLICVVLCCLCTLIGCEIAKTRGSSRIKLLDGINGGGCIVAAFWQHAGHLVWGSNAHYLEP